jgi:hypothetical protein
MHICFVNFVALYMVTDFLSTFLFTVFTVDSEEPLAWPCKLALRLVLKEWHRRRLRMVGQMFAFRKPNEFLVMPSVRHRRTITRRFQIADHRRRALVNVRAVITVYKNRVNVKNIVTIAKSNVNITGKFSTIRMTSVNIILSVEPVLFP